MSSFCPDFEMRQRQSFFPGRSRAIIAGTIRADDLACPRSANSLAVGYAAAQIAKRR
jgi:hypothetical protein